MQITFLFDILPSFSTVVSYSKTWCARINEPAVCIGHDGLIAALNKCRMQFASSSLKVHKSGADVDWDWLPCSIRAASASFSKCFGSAKKATKSIVVRAESIRILGVLLVLGVCGKYQKVCVRRVCERIANLFFEDALDLLRLSKSCSSSERRRMLQDG